MRFRSCIRNTENQPNPPYITAESGERILYLRVTKTDICSKTKCTVQRNDLGKGRLTLHFIQVATAAISFCSHSLSKSRILKVGLPRGEDVSI